MKRRIVVEIEEANGMFTAEISPESDDELLPEELVAAIDALSTHHNEVSDTHSIRHIERLEL